MSQQSRGLPGFLRRTFRNSESSNISNLPDDPPIRSASDGVLDNSVDDTAFGEEAACMNKTKESNSESRVQISSAAIGTPADNEKIDVYGTTDRANPTNEAIVPTTPSSANSTSSRKHLRAVAFPPLPNETHDLDHKDDETTNSSSVKPGRASDTLKYLQAENSNASASTPAPPPKSYKEIQFESILANPIIPIRELRKLAWNGIPPHHRPIIWKILLGYLPANTSRHATTLVRRRKEYKDAMKQHYDIPDDSRTNSEQETLRQVLVDVPRTMPEVLLFHNDRVRRCLSRLLYIWAMRHPASSYVQGINDLATPLIAVFMSGYFEGKDCLDGEVMGDVTDQMLDEIEADTYWCLTNLLAGIQDHYTSDQPGMQRMVMHLEELVNRIDADLAAHLKNTGIEFIQFAFKWMNCLLLREFRLSCVLRLWDTYLSEGDGGFEDFHVYVCASFLVHFSNELQQMGFDELFQFMQVSALFFVFTES